MNRLDFVMLAPVLISPGEMVCLALIVLGPCILAVVGLVRSFRRRKSWALAMVAVSCGTMPAVAVLTDNPGVLKDIFLEWNPMWSVEETFLLGCLKLPFILGIVTLSRVYYLDRKETKERRLGEEIERHIQKREAAESRNPPQSW